MKVINKLFLILLVSLATSPLFAQRVINVTTVDQLYSAVNNAKNAGATIVLAPGTYVLSSTNPEGELRPYGGQLRLRAGMSLMGDEARIDLNFDGIPDPISSTTPDNFTVAGTETMIDGSQLVLPIKKRRNCGSFTTEFFEPMIAINQNNSISSLNLYGGNNIAIGESANPIGSVNSLSAKIENTVIDSFFLPITFANSGCDMSSARSVLILSNSVIRNGGFFGLAIFNFITGNDIDDPSNGPEINATVSHNLFYNNGGTAFTVRGGAVGTDGGLSTLKMTGNVFRNNGSNFLGIAGGGGRETTTAPVLNRLLITSTSDTFGEPTTPSPNVVLVGGRGPNATLHCGLNANFFDTKFIRDTPADKDHPDILILGGEGEVNGNHARVLLRRATVKTSLGVRTLGALVMQDETKTTIPNTARLKGSKEEFLRLNQGFHAPATKFFLTQ